MIKILIPIISFVLLASCSSESKKGEVEVENSAIELDAVKEKVETKKTLELEVLGSVEDSVFTDVVENPSKIALIKEEEIKVEKKKILPPEKIADELLIEKEVSKIEEVVEIEAPVVEIGLSHSLWNKLLQKNVSSSGRVDYKGFKRDKLELEKYITLLKSNSPTKGWSKNEKLAYWINVYNVFTVKLIVANYPLKSITNLNKPWDQKLIDIAGVKYSLGDVENNVLRKMNESRIHFAINCASYSCPQLLNEAFTADKLSSQLRKVTKSFFNDMTKNDLSGNPIKISKLFEWYKGDFSGGNILEYINKYSGKTISIDTKIEYLEYNWSLNE